MDSCHHIQRSFRLSVDVAQRHLQDAPTEAKTLIIREMNSTLGWLDHLFVTHGADVEMLTNIAKRVRFELEGDGDNVEGIVNFLLAGEFHSRHIKGR